MKNPVDALWDVADDVGRAIGDGLTLAAEILCPRDHTAEDRLRSWESATVAVEDEICDEADKLEGEPTAWVDHDLPPMPRNYEDVPVRIHSSADSALSADPSPETTTGLASRAGDEGPEGASAIPPAAPSGQPTDPGAVSTPAPGEQDESPSARELSDYIARSLRNADYDPKSMYVARSLLGGFHITRK
ncbi:hypothetical protein [Mycolicibacterium sp. XJ775]